MSNVIVFKGDAPLAAVANRRKIIDVSKDVVTMAQFPTLHFKGKVWSVSQNNERKVLRNGEGEALQSVKLVPLRINMHTKTFYAKKFAGDESEGQRPDCFSMDGVSPSPHSPNKQSDKCAVCPHNQWGARISEDGRKGKACSDRARMAVAEPESLDTPYLLSVPPTSLRPLKDGIKSAKARGVEYNEVVFKVGFELEEASPVLKFTPFGVLSDEAYESACEAYESEVVRAICGLDEGSAMASAPAPAPAPAPMALKEDPLAAALAARDAQRKAPKAAKPVESLPVDSLDESELEDEAPAPKPAAKAAPKPAAKPAAKAEVKAAPAVDSTVELLGELDSMIFSTDD
jgi:hypothetical protein